MTWEEDEGFRAPSLEGSLVGCDMRDDEIAIRSRALSSADLQVVDGVSLWSVEGSSTKPGQKKSGRCRFCRDPSMLAQCRCCGAYQCEDCQSNTGRGATCNECLTLSLSQQRKGEKARNLIARELIPLPHFMLAKKTNAERCSVCSVAFSRTSYLFSLKHNCKACGEVTCGSAVCVKRRVMCSGDRHKVCLTCSGGDKMPAHAAKDLHPRFHLTTVEAASSTEALSSLSTVEREPSFSSGSGSNDRL